MELQINCDGGARGNPGPAAIGIAIRKKDGMVLYEYKEAIGEATNNVAEYTAACKSLEFARGYEPDSVLIEMDSQLVVKQINGEYNVKAPHLQDLNNRVAELTKGLDVEFTYVPRNTRRQKAADALVNEALDAQSAR